MVAGSIVVAKKDMPSQAYDWEKVTRDNRYARTVVRLGTIKMVVEELMTKRLTREKST